jgi:hypothetical protein
LGLGSTKLPEAQTPRVPEPQTTRKEKYLSENSSDEKFTADKFIQKFIR